MDFDIAHTAAFSGHRSFKIAAGRMQDIGPRLRETLVRLASKGVDTFLCGMAEGFDLMAARAVAELRDGGAAVRLVAAVPFPEQAARFAAGAREEYRELLSRVDRTVVLSPAYDQQVYRRRNDWMLERSFYLVCYYNGAPGGTRYCLRTAMARGMECVNLAAAGGATLF